ncbi:MAG: hypothetical protein JSW34_02075, partial [Candidatus Zixiibacteriota bacterium]
MAVQPLKFEEQFSKLKSGLQSTPSADLRLLNLLSFWPLLRPLVNNRSFDSHVAEYTALLVSHCERDNLPDLKVDELEGIATVLSSLEGVAGRLLLRDDVDAAGETVTVEWARQLFYVGLAESGLRALNKVLGGAADGYDRIDLPPGLDELDTLRWLKEKRGGGEDPATRPLQEILRDWEILREETSHTQLECLFVEKGLYQPGRRGRLRALQAAGEYSSVKARSHEVTFEHQIRSPDDPFVGSVYQALAAVQKLLAGPDFRIRRGDYIHAHFHILPSDHPFTGDSIGLAAALITLVQLLSGEVLRYERGIAFGAAFTGGIDSDGKILAVNNDTLAHKVERAFCSHVKYLVLPRENLPAAREHLAALGQAYPRRRLKLIGVDQLDEAVRDRNIVRSEKICPGQYVIRKAHAYSRLTYIQLPLLAILIYVLACLLYPKAWLGFDWNPQHVALNEAKDRIMVYNQDTTLLWSAMADCPPVERLHFETYDLDGDGKNEIIYVPCNAEAVACSVSARFYVTDHDSKPLFNRSGYIMGEYEGDSVDNVVTGGGRLRVFESSGGPIILTNVAQNYPGRSHLKIWSADGDLLGWYVHAGHLRFVSAKDLDGDGSLEILALAINNPMNGFGLFVLPSVGSHGVSPPHMNTAESPRRYTVGNQWRYV